MATEYTKEVHQHVSRKSGYRGQVTLHRVPGTKPVEVKRAARAAKKKA